MNTSQIDYLEARIWSVDMEVKNYTNAPGSRAAKQAAKRELADLQHRLAQAKLIAG